MKAAQALALDLFEESGFDQVAVTDIASQLGMAASTIYRHFGTKENLILWDEYDPEIDSKLAEKLDTGPPLLAIRDALIGSLGALYDENSAFELRRIGYIYSTPQLHGAAVAVTYAERDELTAALRASGSPEVAKAASIIAGAALMAMNVAVEDWVLSDGGSSLVSCISEAFETLTKLDSIL